MAFQTVFKRYEIKYLLTAEQKQKILRAMAPYMVADQYGKTTVRNIYFDTDNFQLVRHSIDDPVYKEKLRVRSYGAADPQGTVFVELKKKYQKVVYKRRIAMPQKEAAEWMAGISHCRSDSQISREIDYFLEYYKTLKPAVFLSYDRQAYYLKDCSEFRMTFDENILCRRYDINLESGVYGDHVLAEGLTLMEVKCAAGMPLWLTSVLSEEHIYKTSFSKYGMAYKKFIYPALKSGAGTSNNADEPKEAKKYA